ncbi:MAG: hypothetical protein V3V45_05725 [Candidatus Brocadiales bacterium]
MAFKARNPEKVVSCCPVGMRKSQCPSIGITRMLRKNLLRLEMLPDTPLERLEGFRKKLRDKKKAGIVADCPTCTHNTAPKPEPAKASKPAAKASKPVAKTTKRTTKKTTKKTAAKKLEKKEEPAAKG